MKVTKPSPHSDDLEQLSILSALPSDQTSFEYLVSCWKRLNSQRSLLLRRGPTGSVSFVLFPTELLYSSYVQDLERSSAALEKLRDLVISYAGLTLQDSTMFPQPSNG